MHPFISGSRWIKQIKLALSLGIVMAMQSAYADSIDVTARINTGTICAANLSDTQLDYGAIKTSELDREKPTALPTKPLTLNVACAPFASKFFFRVIDHMPNYNRPPEDLGAVVGVPKEEFSVGMGLGVTPDERAIGALFLKSTRILADAQEKVMVRSNGGGPHPISLDWYKGESDFIWGSYGGNRRYAVADPASLILTAAKNFTIQLEATPVISPSAIEGLGAETRIDGKLTIEVTQL